MERGHKQRKGGRKAAFFVGAGASTSSEGVVKGAAIVYEAPKLTAILDQPSPEEAENLLVTIV